MAAYGRPVEEPNIQDFLKFLAVRNDRFGRPIRDLFGDPVQMVGPGNWYRLPWAAFDASRLPQHTPGEFSTSNPPTA
eukprot:14579500-Alexandrium_andersonii.AAC.1